MLLFGLSPSADGCLALFVDLLGLVGHEDAGIGFRRRHFGHEALQRWEESALDREILGVEARGLWGIELCAHIPRHSKVGVLVHAAGNQAGDVLIPEQVGEARGQARRRLDGWVGGLPTVVRERESENGLESGEVDVPLEPDDILVHVPHVLRVDEDEGAFGVEVEREDVLDVLVG